MRVEKIKAIIKFSNKIEEYISDRIWSDDQKIEKTYDGIILTFSTSGDSELISWVLSFGSEAELIAPENLRNEIKKSMENTIKKYGE